MRVLASADSSRTCTLRKAPHEFGIHHHRQGTLPHVLHVRAGVPRQGDPHHRRPGRGDRRALHRLRQLRARLLAARQAAAAARSTRCERCWLRAARGGLPGPQLSRRVHRHPHYTQLVGMLRALGFDLVVEVSFGADLVARRISQAAGRDATATATSPPPARPSSATSSGTIPTWSTRWRRSSRRWSPRPGRCAAARRRPEGGVHRPVHRQEGRGRSARRWPARSTPC